MILLPYQDFIIFYFIFHWIWQWSVLSYSVIKAGIHDWWYWRLCKSLVYITKDVVICALSSDVFLIVLGWYSIKPLLIIFPSNKYGIFLLRLASGPTFLQQLQQPLFIKAFIIKTATNNPTIMLLRRPRRPSDQTTWCKALISATL